MTYWSVISHFYESVSHDPHKPCIHICAWCDSFVYWCVSRLSNSYACDMNYTSLLQNIVSFIRLFCKRDLRSLIVATPYQVMHSYMRGVTRSFIDVWHDSPIHVCMTWPTYSYMRGVTHSFIDVWHDSPIHVCMTRPTYPYIRGMTHSFIHMWHDFLIDICVTWLSHSHILDMTPSFTYAWHDSHIPIRLMWLPHSYICNMASSFIYS